MVKQVFNCYCISMKMSINFLWIKFCVCHFQWTILLKFTALEKWRDKKINVWQTAAKLMLFANFFDFCFFKYDILPESCFYFEGGHIWNMWTWRFETLSFQTIKASLECETQQQLNHLFFTFTDSNPNKVINSLRESRHV